MARTKPLSADLRHAIVHMRHGKHTSVADVAALTGVHPRTVQRVLQTYASTGEAAPERPQNRGHPHKLNSEALEVRTHLAFLSQRRLISINLFKAPPMLPGGDAMPAQVELNDVL